MKIEIAVIGILFAAAAGLMAPAAACAADEIKGGKWQFTTQMRMPPPTQPPSGAAPPSGGNTGMTRTACVDPANPVPAETRQGNVQCKLDTMQRQGGTVTWSMTCVAPQGPPIRSDGVAHYKGDTMEATLTAHMIAPNGQPFDNPGRITGHYLGACDK